VSQDISNTTHHNNTTIAELNPKNKRKPQGKKKDMDAVEESSPPYEKGYKKDPSSDEKFNRTASAETKKGARPTKGKGKVSDEKESASADSEGKKIIE
jgi:hypothetical protein